MECYERLNNAFSSWQEDSPASLEQRVETLETNVSTLTNDVVDIETELATKQDNIADLSEIRSGAAAGATAVQQTAFEAYQQRQDALEAEDRAAMIAMVDGGAKNLFIVTASSGVLNTATIDIADDGSIHVVGKPTNNGAYVLSSNIDLVIPENTYILSVGAEAGNTKISLSLRKKGTTQYVDLYMAERRIIPAGTYDRAHIYLYADTVYDTYIYPMVCAVADYTISPAFVPHRPSWQEMYDMIKALQNGA